MHTNEIKLSPRKLTEDAFLVHELMQIIRLHHFSIIWMLGRMGNKQNRGTLGPALFMKVGS